MRVAIIGQGYVGLTISAFAAAHHDVVGFDMNAGVVERLNNGVSHIEGVDSDVLKKWVDAGK
jgi:UDP-N-acetyl-D-glucosamine dehydrogenase